MALSARAAALLALIGLVGCATPSFTASIDSEDSDVKAGKRTSKTGADTGDDDDDDDREDTPGGLKGEPSSDYSCEGRADAIDALTKQFDTERRAQKLTGAAIAVVCKGSLLFSAGVGERKQGGGQKVSGKTTRFNWASITKSLVATTAVRLSKAGKVDLDGPVSAQIPGLGNAPYARPFTWAELLSHTAGYPTMVDSGSLDGDARVEASLKTKLWSPPGALHNYSNEGFLVAGYGLQKAAGTPLRDLVEREVMKPAQMTNATMHPDVAASGDFAFGHTDGQFVGPNDLYLGTTYYTAMGGAWGSAEDLARFAQQLMAGSDGPLVDDASFERMTTPRGDAGGGAGYGLGLEVTKRGDFVTVAHSGGAPGFGSYVVMVPSERFAVAMLFNGDGFVDIADAAFEKVTGHQLGDAAVTPASPADKAAAVGTYKSLKLGDLEVTSGGAELELTIGSQNRTTKLFATERKDQYYAVLDESYGQEESVRFVREKGAVKYLVTTSGVGTR